MGRQEFTSEFERLVHDAKGLIERAEKLSLEQGKTVDPSSLAARAGDSNLASLRLAIVYVQEEIAQKLMLEGLDENEDPMREKIRSK